MSWFIVAFAQLSALAQQLTTRARAEIGHPSLAAPIDVTVPKAMRRTDGMHNPFEEGMTESNVLTNFKRAVVAVRMQEDCIVSRSHNRPAQGQAMLAVSQVAASCIC
jgi:hypothetical protein